MLYLFYPKFVLHWRWYITGSYIYNRVQKLIKKYHTRNPFKILENMNVIVIESDRYKFLKGFCFISCRMTYVVINSFLTDAVKQIVAAHELAHVTLHQKQLKIAPMKDTVLYDMTSQTEYEANLFAADLLLDDEEIHKLARDKDMDYFNMCRSLYVTPDFMSFKLFSLIQRGHSYNMPQGLNSKFLARK